jgi:hypothetical protein
MTTARIIEQDRKTTQSGRAKSGKWSLEFESGRAQAHDPLTGWVGAADTRTQVRLAFDVVPAPPVKLKLQAYADNFR